ncbi:MAG TPA: SurA N-terminal domain-containing protein, partial [Methylomirabilota bacterium]|nr:SurA N-terminal domain-containing protein [Methylomirabilota bacterium]
MKRRCRSHAAVVILIALALLLSGCGTWGRLFGKSDPAASQPQALPESPRDRSPARVESPPPGAQEEAAQQPRGALTDRVVAVVNQEAITLMDLLETIQFLLQQSGGDIKPGEETKIRAQVLDQLIERRLQVQEAMKEKFTVADEEIKEMIDEMMKRTTAKSREEFEEVLKQQGLAMEAVRKGARDQLLAQKIIRRKVSARFSVTDQEVDAYFNENRGKLETGLPYHARHILLPPEPSDSEAGWEAARAAADEVWEKIRAGEP